MLKIQPEAEFADLLGNMKVFEITKIILLFFLGLAFEARTGSASGLCWQFAPQIRCQKCDTFLLDNKLDALYFSFAMSKESLVAEVSQTITLYEGTIGQAATRTRMMIEDYGEINALSRLMKSTEIQPGFKALRDAGKLDNTFEAIVVRFSGLFAADVVEAAKSRLKNSDNL